jgi:hypothetical protein
LGRYSSRETESAESGEDIRNAMQSASEVTLAFVFSTRLREIALFGVGLDDGGCMVLLGNSFTPCTSAFALAPR